MTSAVAISEPAWFVLKHFTNGNNKNENPARQIERFNNAGHRLELFAPTILEKRTVGERNKLVERPLMYHYVFVKGNEDEVKDLCTTAYGFSFVLSRSTEDRYAKLSDEAMHSFMIVARAYSNNLPFFSLENVNLEAGDLVEIVDGKFAGLTGVYIPKKRSKKGSLIIAGNMQFATVVYEVEANNIRVLEYARNTKRLYDIIDAFVPRLFVILRKFTSGDTLTEKDITALTVFCNRTQSARLDNQKSAAKLGALLLAAAYILGRDSEVRAARQMLDRYSPSVTNVWTQSLIDLIIAVIYSDAGAYRRGLQRIGLAVPGESKSKTDFRAEYEYYRPAMMPV